MSDKMKCKTFDPFDEDGLYKAIIKDDMIKCVKYVMECYYGTEERDFIINFMVLVFNEHER